MPTEDKELSKVADEIDEAAQTTTWQEGAPSGEVSKAADKQIPVYGKEYKPKSIMPKTFAEEECAAGEECAKTAAPKEDGPSDEDLWNVEAQEIEEKTFGQVEDVVSWLKAAQKDLLHGHGTLNSFNSALLKSIGELQRASNAIHKFMTGK